MKLSLLLFLAFIIQEPISSGVLILHAYQSGYNLFFMHAIFCIATIIDIFVGYKIGSYIHKRYKDKQLVTYLRRKLETFLEFIGKNGKIVGLLVFVPLIFPISAIFLPWLNIKLREAFIYVLIGEIIIWYGSEWLLVLTTKAFVSDARLALYAVFVVLLLISIATKLLIKKYRKK